MMRLENKVAIITGGGEGIGRGIAVKFAKEGANIVICDIDLEATQKTAKDVTSMGHKSLAIKSDVANSIDVKKSVKRLLKNSEGSIS